MYAVVRDPTEPQVMLLLLLLLLLLLVLMLVLTLSCVRVVAQWFR